MRFVDSYDLSHAIGLVHDAASIVVKQKLYATLAASCTSCTNFESSALSTRQSNSNYRLSGVSTPCERRDVIDRNQPG